jgi:hypothetical protein
MKPILKMATLNAACLQGNLLDPFVNLNPLFCFTRKLLGQINVMLTCELNDLLISAIHQKLGRNIHVH